MDLLEIIKKNPKYEYGSFSILPQYYDISERDLLFLSIGTYEGADFSKAYLVDKKNKRKSIKLDEIIKRLAFDNYKYSEKKYKDSDLTLNLNKSKFNGFDLIHLKNYNLTLKESIFENINELRIWQNENYTTSGESSFFENIDKLTISGSKINSKYYDEFSSCNTNFPNSTFIEIPNLNIKKVNLSNSIMYKVKIEYDEFHNKKIFEYIDFRGVTCASSDFENISFDGRILLSPRTLFLNCNLKKSSFFECFKPMILDDGIKQLVHYNSPQFPSRYETMWKEFNITRRD